MKSLKLTALVLALMLCLPMFVMAQDYVGSSTCSNCHNLENGNLGYNIVEEYNKAGHPYKLNPVDGAPPTFPENTSPGVPNPPPGTSWNDYSYVIGGYGWKARFVKLDGKIQTAGDQVQYNLETEGWVAYSQDEDKPYNYSCFKCHTTGASPDGSWNDQTDGLGTFTEPGIRCEGCHGPGGDHVSDPSGNAMPLQGEDLTITRCGDCHQRGGTTNAIPASGNYIRHHEQLNEMRASAHGDGAGSELTCGTCHDTHIAGRYPEAAGDGLNSIKMNCESCHSDYQITIDGVEKSTSCVDCHMPMASKSAVGMQVGNGWRGDVMTHLWAINTDPVTREAMFTEDGSLVELDENGHGAVTLDFVCLQCHQSETVEWAAQFADGIHEGDLTSVEESGDDLVASANDFDLKPNFPNPFQRMTNIQFDLREGGHVELAIFNSAGQKVKTLVDQTFSAGIHEVNWDSTNDIGDTVAPGIYFYQLNMNGVQGNQRMVLLK